MTKRERRTYTEEFKEQMVKLYERGFSIFIVSQEARIICLDPII